MITARARVLLAAAMLLAATSCGVVGRPDVEVVRTWWEPPHGMQRAVRGVVRNNTRQSFSDVTVIVEHGDLSGRPSGTDTVHVGALDANQVRVFSTHLLPGWQEHYRVIGISARGRVLDAPVSPSRIPTPLTRPSSPAPSRTPAAPGSAPPPTPTR